MIPVLRTERLVLRAFTEADLDAFAAMQADPDFMRHLGADGMIHLMGVDAELWRYPPARPSHRCNP